jgi:hypothetical protein
MRPLSAATVALVLSTAPMAFLLHRYGARTSGQPAGRRLPGRRTNTTRVILARASERANRTEQRELQRQRTWTVVSRFCADRDDVAKLHYRYQELSTRAAREEFSSLFGSRIMFITATSATHVLIYFYLAYTIAPPVRSDRGATAGWWTTFPLFISSALAILVILLNIDSPPKVVIFAFSCVGSVLCLAGIVWAPRQGVNSNLGSLMLLSGGTLILLAADASIVALVTASVRRKLWTYRSAEPHLFADLQSALLLLTTREDALSDLANCGEITRLLERAASCSETGLYRALSLQYGPSSLVVKSRLEGAARRLRGYQTWVALPAAGTQQELERELSRFLIVLCCREYDALPWSPLPDNTLPQRARKVFSTLGTLVVGVVPLAAIKGAQHEGLLGDSLAQGLLLPSLIWLLALVFPVVEPLFGPRLSAVKDLAGAMRSIGGGDK